MCPSKHVLAKLPNGWYVCERCFETFNTESETSDCIPRIRKSELARNLDYKLFDRWLKRNETENDPNKRSY